MKFVTQKYHKLRPAAQLRSEEHTSELQSQSNLVCRLLLEKKKCPHAPKSIGAPRSRPGPPAKSETAVPTTTLPGPDPARSQASIGPPPSGPSSTPGPGHDP